MKREYMKPTMRVVKLQHKCQILSVSDRSLRGVNNTGLDDDDEDDDIDIDDTTVGNGFWGR